MLGECSVICIPEGENRLVKELVSDHIADSNLIYNLSICSVISPSSINYPAIFIYMIFPFYNIIRTFSYVVFLEFPNI